MKLSLIIAVLCLGASLFAAAPAKPVDAKTSQPHMMTLYEQGWGEGAKVGNQNSGKIGWFFAGFGNIPLLWLPWTVEPRRPPKPSIFAEEEFNNGFKHGYRAGWKNAHKTYYIAGAIVESAIVGGILIANKSK